MRAMQIKTYLIYSRNSTLSIHTEPILLPERTIAVEVDSEILEEWRLNEVVQAVVQVVRDALYGLKIARGSFYGSRGLSHT
jgi:hypothetical protein